MQLQYRNMGSHESLWATHTVDEGGLAVARWYEVRDPGGSPTLFQQGSLNPGDGVNRWMASIAADQDGNAAIGYSVSNSSMYPGHPLPGPAERRVPRPDAADRADADQRHRLADRHQPLGRLQRDDASTRPTTAPSGTPRNTTPPPAATGRPASARSSSPPAASPRARSPASVVNAVTNDGVPGAPVTIASVVESSSRPSRPTPTATTASTSCPAPTT